MEKDRLVINVDVLVIPCSGFLCVWHFITLQTPEQQLQVERKVKVEWYPLYRPKLLFKFGEKRPIVCYCTREQKMNFEGFTQNCCYGNQPQPFEIVFYSINANTSCSFTKQDLTVKQAHRASFWFVLWFELLAVNSCSQCFLQAFNGNNLISYHTHRTNHPPSRDRSFLAYITTTLLVFNYPSFRNST